LPEKCIKTTRTPDKTAIKTLLKAGVDVPGAKLTYSETLNIR
jgi:Siphovirus Gp157.